MSITETMPLTKLAGIYLRADIYRTTGQIIHTILISPIHWFMPPLTAVVVPKPQNIPICKLIWP